MATALELYKNQLLTSLRSHGPGALPLENEKWELFCLEYIKEKNGTASAKAAGYSPKTAHVQASRMLRNVKVAGRIEFLLAQMKAKAILSVEDNLYRLIQIRDFNISKLFHLDGVWVDEDGTVRAFESVEDDEEKQELMFAQRLLLNSDAIKEYGHLIESITETAKGGISIKLVSKQAAIKMLGDFQQTWRPQEEDPKTPGGLDPHMEVFPDDPNDPRYDELLDALE